MRLYLDTSAFVKRYIKEEGSEEVRKIFISAYNGDAVLHMHLFNVGEALSAIHKATRRAGRPEIYPLLKKRLLGDVRRLTKLGAMRLTPLTISQILEASKYVEKHSLYIVDALQIISAIQTNSELITGDEKLCNVAEAEGVKCRQI
ncbi:type II toxin-antitoxin system VapC family toxin [Pyrobaculum sp.]|uniref:type II toxin-antitoxin system VapC family toxin n=1 Tax=Pyrobaculum sp. TaxID=2004705 RepID=UPI003D128A7A